MNTDELDRQIDELLDNSPISRNKHPSRLLAPIRRQGDNFNMLNMSTPVVTTPEKRTRRQSRLNHFKTVLETPKKPLLAKKIYVTFCSFHCF